MQQDVNNLDFERDLEEVLAGGEKAKALLKGSPYYFDEWLEDSEIQKRVMEDPRLSRLLEVLADFAFQKEDLELQANSIWALGWLPLATRPESVPEKIYLAAEQGIRSSESWTRVWTARLVSALGYKDLYSVAQRAMLRLFLEKEFEEWGQVSSAADNFHELGGELTEEDSQKLYDIIIQWFKAVEDRVRSFWKPEIRLPLSEVVKAINSSDISNKWDYAFSAVEFLGRDEAISRISYIEEGRWWYNKIKWKDYQEDLKRAVDYIIEELKEEKEFGSKENWD